MNRFVELFLTFAKIGAFTFGGGYAMLPLIQQEVARQGWLTDAQLVENSGARTISPLNYTA